MTRPRTPAIHARAWPLVSFFALASCSASEGEFERALASAGAHARSGALDQAASDYARLANDERLGSEDRAEALYRLAHLERERDDADAARSDFQRLLREFGQTSRAPRAALDLGRLEERQGKTNEALGSYRNLLARFPDSAGAEPAAAAIARLSGAPESKTLAELRTRNGPELDETLRWLEGKALEAEGNARAAIDAYEALVARHPLPTGRFADDALLRAAKLRRSLGDEAGCLDTLDVLLDSRTRATIVGSHERPTYAEGHFLAGLVLRDDLDRPSEALARFSSLPIEHPDSRLVDDAYWQAAMTARSLTDSDRACAEAKHLTEARPDSRFARCLGIPCPERFQNEDEARCARLVSSTSHSEASAPTAEVPGPPGSH